MFYPTRLSIFYQMAKYLCQFDKSFLLSSVLLGATTILFRYAGILKLDWTWVGLGMAGLIGARGWMCYKNKRNKYMVNLSHTIYFKIDRGVVTLLTNRAQDEEFKKPTCSCWVLETGKVYLEGLSLMPDQTMTLQNPSSTESKLGWRRTTDLMTYLSTSKMLWMF